MLSNRLYPLLEWATTAELFTSFHWFAPSLFRILERTLIHQVCNFLLLTGTFRWMPVITNFPFKTIFSCRKSLIPRNSFVESWTFFLVLWLPASSLDRVSLHFCLLESIGLFCPWHTVSQLFLFPLPSDWPLDSAVAPKADFSSCLFSRKGMLLLSFQFEAPDHHMIV